MRLRVLVALLALGWSAGAWGHDDVLLEGAGGPGGYVTAGPRPPSGALPAQTQTFTGDVTAHQLPPECWVHAFPPAVTIDGATGRVQYETKIWSPAGVVESSGTLLSQLRREITAAAADDDADTIATLEAAVQAIKRRHARQP